MDSCYKRLVRLTRLKVEHYRGIDHLEIKFAPDEQATVLFGKNGTGKSGLLDALAILFEGLFSSLHGSTRGRRTFTADDITNGQPSLRATAELSVDGALFSWSLSRTRSNDRKAVIQDLRSLTSTASRLRQKLGEEAWSILPLTVLYPVNRSVLDFPRTPPTTPPFERIDAYDRSLSGGAVTFRTFFEWFISAENRESNALRFKRRKSPDPELNAVREAIKRLTGFADLYTDQTQVPVRLMLKKGPGELAINQLSDGERGVFALAGDLARRLATANPTAKQPLAAPGIVLIDEVDLHLHPAWQARVIHELTDTFSGCQFVVTTHSPEVISRVHRNTVFRLDRTLDNVVLSRPRGARGFDVNSILHFMEAPTRDEKEEQRLRKLFDLIGRGQLEEARALRDQLARENGEEEPELSRAAVLINRRELLGR